MGETQVHHQVLALLADAVADAVDVQLLLVALVDAHHHVVQQGAGETVEGAVLLGVGGALHNDLRALLLDDHRGMEALGQGALGALDGDHVALGDVDLDTGGDGNGHSSNSTHVKYPPYQMNARTSPPTWAARAALSVMTPLDVEMMAMPRPRRTRGSSSAPA